MTEPQPLRAPAPDQEQCMPERIQLSRALEDVGRRYATYLASPQGQAASAAARTALDNLAVAFRVASTKAAQHFGTKDPRP